MLWVETSMLRVETSMLLFFYEARVLGPAPGWDPAPGPLGPARRRRRRASIPGHIPDQHAQEKIMREAIPNLAIVAELIT